MSETDGSGRDSTADASATEKKPTLQRVLTARDEVVGHAVEATLKTAETAFKTVGTLSGPLKAKMQERLNWFTQTEWFKSTCNDVFDSVDIDDTKTIDVKELYAAVLLVYVYISRLVPGGAYPPTAQDVTELMHAVCPGEIEVGHEQFQAICVVLMGNISQRLIFQVILAFLVCPFLGSLIVTIWCLFHTPSGILPALIPDGFMPSVFASLILMLILPKTLNYIDKRTVQSVTAEKKQN